jgi:coproporphyrinogen III oxidase-like Fe-S oxidoreductase
MLRMRLFRGIDEADFEARFGASFEEVYGDISRLVAGGFLVREGGRLAFSEKGMYVSNAILSEWLDFRQE